MRLFLEIFLFFDYDRDSITEDVEVAMDIQHLKYFVEVVRQESFTRAAAQLFVTQPMLTRSIKQLEESLNVLLIERTSKSFHLTDAGRILYERAQEFLMQYEAIFQTMADVRSVKTGGAAGHVFSRAVCQLSPAIPRHRHQSGGGGLQAHRRLGGIGKGGSGTGHAPGGGAVPL